jgi:SAM-dependent methyltransferase
LIEDPAFYAVVERVLDRGRELKVLDAGCGAHFPFRLERAAHITGMDISRASMERSRHLDAYLVGDIQEYRFQRTFDLVVCMNVLEHVARPDRAIANLAASLAPGGILVLGFPNPVSVKGLVTRFTPHWAHVLILRRFFGFAHAGEPGYAPFPTYLRFALARTPLERLLRQNDLGVVWLKQFEGNQPAKLRARAFPLFAAYRIACVSMNVLSIGALRADLSETLVIARSKVASA